MNEAITLSSAAHVPTELPRRYLAQLCKHFQHRLPVTFDDTHGQITFASGLCEVEAAADGLTLHVRAADEAALAQVEDVVARHLKRFAFREEPEVRWSRVDPEA